MSSAELPARAVSFESAPNYPEFESECCVASFSTTRRRRPKSGNINLLLTSAASRTGKMRFGPTIRRPSGMKSRIPIPALQEYVESLPLGQKDGGQRDRINGQGEIRQWQVLSIPT